MSGHIPAYLQPANLTAVIWSDTATTFVTSGFLCNVHENHAVLDYYILLVLYSRVNNPTEPCRWD